MVPGFKISVSYSLLTDEQQIHTLDKSALVQSVCMDIDLIKTIVRLTSWKEKHKQLPEHHTFQQHPSNS
jgi:hypothetical protein